MIVDLAYALMSKGQEREQKGGGVGKTIWHIVSLCLFIGAIAVSWNCNTKAGSGVGMKVLYAFVAGLFSHIYLVFHLIYRLMLGNPC